MIFDDHDIRDDWNTSAAWKQEMEATDWWHGRIVAGLGSYWVHQHLGNMTPAERADDEVWRAIAAHADDEGEYDATDLLDAFADRVDQKPETYRWSYARELGPDARLRGRGLPRRAGAGADGERSMLDDSEMAWLDEQMRGDVDHLLDRHVAAVPAQPRAALRRGVGTRRSPRAPGARAARPPGRRDGCGTVLDLEHWAAFQDGFQKVARDDARGGPRRARPARRGRSRSSPATSTTATSPRPGPPPRPSAGHAARPEPDHPGRLLADPQPDAAPAALPRRGPGVRRRRADRPRRGPVGQGPRGTAEVEAARGPVVRQQPGHPRGRPTRGLRMWWATGQVEDGAARPPAADEGRRADRRREPATPRRRCHSCSPPRPPPASRPCAAPASSRW